MYKLLPIIAFLFLTSCTKIVALKQIKDSYPKQKLDTTPIQPPMKTVKIEI